MNDQQQAGTVQFRSTTDVWRAFASRGTTVAHGSRVIERYGDSDTWSAILRLDGPEIAGRIAAIRAALPGEGITWYDPTDLHVTLLMGRQEPAPIWFAAVPAIAGGFAPFEASVTGVNAFPQSVFLEVHDAGALLTLREELLEVPGAEAFDHRQSPYLPHVSIAAFERDDIDTAGVAEALAPFRDLPPIAVRFTELVVSRIRFDGGGQVHTIDELTYPFRGGSA